MSYAASLSDSEWQTIQPVFNSFGYSEENRKYPLIIIVNAIFYVVNNGVKWRELPKDFPPWQTVYYNFSKWSLGGLWAILNFSLVAKVRVMEGRDASPSLVSIDSQSLGGEAGIKERGLDGNKKVNGRKRHIVVDVLGLMIGCLVTAANESDVHAGKKFVKQLNNSDLFPRLELILADNAYESVGQEQRIPVTVENKKRQPGQRGFVPEAFRWVVERSFAWLNRQRRLVRNYEKKIRNQEAMNYIGNIRICLSKIKKKIEKALKQANC